MWGLFANGALVATDKSKVVLMRKGFAEYTTKDTLTVSRIK